jgi:hypothetical protein
VNAAYYDLVQQQQQLAFGYNNCDFKPAIDLGTKRFTIGKASNLVF